MSRIIKMDMYIWIAILVGCCIGIMKSCDWFELGTDYDNYEYIFKK